MTVAAVTSRADAAFPDPHDAVVVGVDAGGSWLRVTVCDLAGQVLRSVRQSAGREGDIAGFSEIAVDTLRAAVGGRLVIAGAGTNARGIDHAWSDAQVGGAPFATMSEATLAAGPKRHAGLVVIAGTGSAVASLWRGREMVVTGADPEAPVGCGLWMGRQALAASSAGLRGLGPSTALTELVADAIVAQHLDVAVRRSVASLSVVVDEAARAGDDVAGAICDEAARGLFGLLDGHDMGLYGADGLVTVGSVVDPKSSVGSTFAQLCSQAGLSFAEHLPSLDLRAVDWALSTLPGRA